MEFLSYLKVDYSIQYIGYTARSKIIGWKNTFSTPFEVKTVILKNSLSKKQEVYLAKMNVVC